MKPAQAKILVIVPAFNEEKSIAAVVQLVRQAMPGADVLVINDKSTDHTEHILQKNGLSYLSLPVNLGIGGAVQTGFIYAAQNDYDIAVQVDGDGQHPPEQIPNLIDCLTAGPCDCVIGSRNLAQKQMVSSRARRLGGSLLSLVLFLTTWKKITDPTSGFRAYSRRAVQFLSRFYPQDYPEPISVMDLLKNGFVIQEIPVVMQERAHGQSSITGINTVAYMIKVIFAILISKIRRGNLCQKQP
jgi:glycosyltransferase involved in cell wall biosynthesis